MIKDKKRVKIVDELIKRRIDQGHGAYTDIYYNKKGIQVFVSEHRS